MFGRVSTRGWGVPAEDCDSLQNVWQGVDSGDILTADCNFSVLYFMKIQSGGAFIDQGAFGCTFFSAVNCSDGTSLPDKLGKVFNDNSDALEEYENNKIVSTFDPEHLFTVKLYKICDVGTFQDGDRPEMCEFLRKYTDKDHKQLIYEYGGIDFDNLHNRVAMRTIPFDVVMLSIESLLYGLVVMSVYGYVHLDVSYKNVLFNEAINKTMLIDFGWLSLADDVYREENGTNYGHEYLWYPPEFKIAALCDDDDMRNASFSAFYQMFKSNFKSRKMNLHDYESLFPASIADLKRLYGFIKHDLKGDTTKTFRFLRTVAHKIDVYSVGMVLCCIVKRFSAIIGTTPFVAAILNLIGKITNLDPVARFDALQTYTLYIRIMRKFGQKPVLYRRAIIVSAPELMQYRKMTSGQLKHVCERLGVKVSGKKSEMLIRLIKEQTR